MNTALGVILLITAFYLSAIYGNGLSGATILVAFTFLGKLIVIAANLSH
jgi:hypothetical protein